MKTKICSKCGAKMNPGLGLKGTGKARRLFICSNCGTEKSEYAVYRGKAKSLDAENKYFADPDF